MSTRSPILAGTLKGNGGVIPDGSWKIQPGPGVTIQGAGPGQTIIEAAGSPCRIEIPEMSPGVTLAGFSAAGSFGPFGSFDPSGIQKLRQFVHR